MEQIRVLYDACGFQEPHGGVSRYFTELIKHLPRDFSPIVSVRETRNAYLRGEPFNVPWARYSLNDFLPGIHFRGKSIVYGMLARSFPNLMPSFELANERAFEAAIEKDDFDVLHLTGPHNVGDVWRKVVGKKPIVITIHDLIPEIMGVQKRSARHRADILHAASRIIAVSQNTKSDLIRLYSVPDEKISVVYHGYTAKEGQDEAPLFPDMRYLLYVGKRGSYKNSDFLIRSLLPILREDESLHLVFTGNPFRSEEVEVFQKERIERQVHHIFVPDTSMLSVFAHAIGFIYPSLYEGFGIPILDAFHAGCPVILSNASCFPEVAGDAALYFEKDDSEGLRRCVRRVVEDDNLRIEMVKKGKERVREFSWERTARQTSYVYEEVLDRIPESGFSCAIGKSALGEYRRVR